MLAATENLDFERAAVIRDRNETMRDNVGEPVDAVKKPEKARGRGRRQKSNCVPRPKKIA